jgi:L-lactate dehydrogenase complex protein LldG
VDRDAFLSLLSVRLAPVRSPDRAVEVPPLPSLAPEGEELAGLFASRATQVGATVRPVRTRTMAFDAVAGLLEAEGHARVACPPHLRFSAIAGMWTADPREASFGLSEAHWGIAETGSVVFCHRGPRGRGYSLVPPTVGILLAASRLVPSLAAVLSLIDADPPPACITFMTGVSHSSDIAGIPCSGVHGPGSVHVWLIDDE